MWRYRFLDDLQSGLLLEKWGAPALNAFSLSNIVYLFSRICLQLSTISRLVTSSMLAKRWVWAKDLPCAERCLRDRLLVLDLPSALGDVRIGSVLSALDRILVGSTLEVNSWTNVWSSIRKAGQFVSSGPNFCWLCSRKFLVLRALLRSLSSREARSRCALFSRSFACPPSLSAFFL